MTLSLGYILESAYNNPQVILIFLFFSGVFGLMIWPQVSELIRLRREQRGTRGRTQLHEALRAESPYSRIPSPEIVNRHSHTSDGIQPAVSQSTPVYR